MSRYNLPSQLPAGLAYLDHIPASGGFDCLFHATQPASDNQKTCRSQGPAPRLKPPLPTSVRSLNTCDRGTDHKVSDARQGRSTNRLPDEMAYRAAADRNQDQAIDRI